MKSPLPGTLLFLCFGTAASAQLSLRPQIGLESAKTSISSNGSSFSSLGTAVAPQASLRLDYKFKKMGGPYIGLGTSPAVATVTTTNPESLMSNFKSSLGAPKIRLDAGWGFSTKAINLQKKGAGSKSAAPAPSAGAHRTCGSYSYHGGCNRSRMTHAVQKKPDTWNLRIQPSAGLAFTSVGNNDITTQNGTTATAYSYKAGVWNTAVTTGVDFAFAKGRNRKFVVGVNYLKGLGNLGDQRIASVTEGKMATTSVQSRLSAWNVSFGIPFTLSKQRKMVQTKPQDNRSHYRGGCGEYRRCTRSI